MIVGRIIILIWTYVNNLLDTLSEENKTLRLGDFSIDLLKFDQNSPTNEFLDSFFSYAPAL